MRTWILRFRTKDLKNFEEVRSGEKRIETRAATPRYQKVEKGDSLIFMCGTKRLTKKVTRVTRFKSVDGMLRMVPMRAIMPSVASTKEMKRTYAGYSGYEDKIKKFGIVAWHLK